MRVNQHQAEFELMQRVARGESEAFRALYATHKKRVYGICVRLMGRGPGAEDMTQDVWIRIVNNASQYRPVAGLSAWLSQLTRNACLNQLRKQRPEEFIESFDEAGEEAASSDGGDVFKELTDRESLARAFSQLPAQQRAVLVMTVHEELSHSEIAVELNLSVGAVKQLVFRAKENLRKYFKGGA